MEAKDILELDIKICSPTAQAESQLTTTIASRRLGGFKKVFIGYLMDFGYTPKPLHKMHPYEVGNIFLGAVNDGKIPQELAEEILESYLKY